MVDINNYEGLYGITEDGKIYSYPKKYRSSKGRWLKNWINNHGYFCVNLYKNKKRKVYQVHRLLAKHFLKNNINNKQVNHKDGNKLNNSIDNLEWVTAKENAQHAMRNNLMTQYSEKQIITRSLNGKKTGAINSKKSRRLFSLNEANEIRKIHEVGKKSCLAISKIYDCASKTIDNICNYKTYLT